MSRMIVEVALLSLILVGCGGSVDLTPDAGRAEDAGQAGIQDASVPDTPTADVATGPTDASIQCCRWSQQTWIPIAPAEGGPVYGCFASIVQVGCPLGYQVGPDQ